MILDELEVLADGNFQITIISISAGQRELGKKKWGVAIYDETHHKPGSNYVWGDTLEQTIAGALRMRNNERQNQNL